MALWKQILLLLFERIPNVSLATLLVVPSLSLRQQSRCMISAAFDSLVTPSVQPNLRAEDHNT
jgi:hypothetical protein